MRSLERQLPFAAAALLAVMAALLTFASYDVVRDQARELAEVRLANLTEQLATSLSGSAVESRAELDSTAADPRLAAFLARPDESRRAAAVETLESIERGQGGRVFVVLWDMAGEAVVTVPARSDTISWLDPPSLVDTTTTTPLMAGRGGAPYLGVVAPVRQNRRLVGYVHRVQFLQEAPQTRQTIATLVGPEGQLLLGSQDGIWTDLGDLVEAPPPEATAASGLTSYERAGERQLGSARAIPGTPWILLAELPERIALAHTETYLWRVGLIALALLVATTVAAWTLGHRITSPLSRLREAADAVADGDFGSRAEVSGPPEIAGLARAFNHMADETSRHMGALKEGEQRFRSLVTATSQIVWWMDPEGNVVDPLPSWQAFTGQPFDQIRGAGWTGALHPEDAAGALRVWKEAVARRSLFETEYRIRRHDGEYRWFIARAVPILARDGTIREWVGTCEDVTKRRDAEEKLRRKDLELQQAQRLDAVGQLAGGIAHDFNNLLTAVLGPADLALLQLPPDHPVRSDLQEIRSAALRASELTRHLLTFGRQQVMSPSLLDLNEVVESATKLLRRVIGESVKLDIALSADSPVVKLDRTQLEQVIVNLAVNARDAMPEGGRLTIETENVQVGRDLADHHTGLRPGAYVQLSVSDGGTGMDEETQKRIFEPFFTTKGRGEGTGLGLSTVYGIVRQSGGHIWVYSEPGEGTVFKIFFPEAVGDPVELRPEAEADEVPTGTETVLVAEDQPELLELGVRILTRLGYAVLRAKNGEEALHVARGHAGDISLLLSDVVMPELNGLELWDRLRMERPSVRALFLSGWASDAVVRHGILDGTVPFLQKPFTPAQLGFKVREVLDGVA